MANSANSSAMLTQMPKLHFVNQETYPTNASINASLRAVTPPPPSTSVPSPSMPSTSVPSGNASQMGGARRSTSKSKAQSSKKTTSKSSKGAKGVKGGALMDDVKNLAVPFAILLAKQGLESIFAKKEKESNTNAKSAKPASNAKAPQAQVTARRKTAMGGGSCGSACAAAAQSGGRRASSAAASSANQKVEARFAKLSKEIDNFLAKY